MKIPNDKLPLRVGKFMSEEVIYDKNNLIYTAGHPAFDHMLSGTINELQYLVDAANNFEKAIKILKNIKLDAEMALDDRWDRSDSGFQCQIEIINEFLKDLEDD